MTNMDPRQTSGPDGSGATQHQGPDTIDTSETEQFMPGNDIEFGADSDGDGDVEIDENRWDSWEEYEEYQERMAELRAIEREREEAEAAEAEARAEAAAAEQEAREEAHANGEPYHEGSGTHEGEPVEIFTTPNGETVMVNDEGEVVAVAFPSEPIFMGYMTVIGSDGEPTSTQMFQLHDGTNVLVEDGELLGTLDEVEIPTVDTSIIPEHLYPQLAEADEVYLQPMGPPSYDTYVIDAATGEPIDEMDTGTPFLGTDQATVYHPPGTDLAMVIETESGQVIDTWQVPPEPEWEFLGVIEVYDGGLVSIDLAVVEVEFDVIGPEKSFSVGVDLFFIEVGAGVEWDTDGNWDFEAYVDVDTGVFEWGGEFSIEMDEGEFRAALDGYMGVQMGSLEAGVEGGVDITIGPDGVEVGADAAATASGKFMGTEVDLRLEGGVDIGPGGVEGYLGANGALQSNLFGDFEAGASWDSDAGFDSYAGSPENAAGAANGLDMGWTDDVEADGFETSDGEQADLAARLEDAEDVASRIEGDLPAGRRFADDDDGGDGDGADEADGADLADAISGAKMPGGDGRFARDGMPGRPGRGERDAADEPGPSSTVAGEGGGPDRSTAIGGDGIAERPAVRDVFEDLAPGTDVTAGDRPDGPTASEWATFEPNAEAAIAERGAASTPPPTDPPAAEARQIELMEDPITAAPGRAAAASESADEQPTKALPAAERASEPVEPAVGRSAEAPPAAEPAPERAAAPVETEPEPAPAPEPPPEPVAPVVEVEVEPPPAPEPPPEPPPIDEPELDPLDGTT